MSDHPRRGSPADAGREARPLVKICGLTRNADARRADEAGADFLGVVLSSGFRRTVSSSGAAAVLEGTSAARVAVLVDEAPAAAARLAASIDATVLQLHGVEDRAYVDALRGLSDGAIWKAVCAVSLDDVRRVVDAMGDVVEGLLVEGRKPGVVGGGGARLMLDAMALRTAIPADVAFVLAGGLTHTNVGEAVARYRPDVVDVSSGVERSIGGKHHPWIDSFVSAARPGPPGSPGRRG